MNPITAQIVNIVCILSHLNEMTLSNQFGVIEHILLSLQK